ncbi:MAG: hypothetical protein U1E31_01615 [Rickettsiales bacterium]
MKTQILEIVHIDFDEKSINFESNENFDQNKYNLNSNHSNNQITDISNINQIENVQNINLKETLQFLQKIISNDIINCNSTFAFLLTPKAKYVSDFIITVSNNRIFIEIAEKLVETFINKINLYKIGLQIKIIKTNYCSIFIPENKITEIDLSNIEQFIISKEPDPRGDNIGIRLIVKNNYITKEISEKNLVLDFIAKYENNILNYVELDENCNITKYTNKGFSYIKGCYIGQEVISYAKSSGIRNNNIFKIDNYLENKLDINILQKEENSFALDGNAILLQKQYDIYCNFAQGDINSNNINTNEINTISSNQQDDINAKDKNQLQNILLNKNDIKIGYILSLIYIKETNKLMGFCFIENNNINNNSQIFIKLQNKIIPINLINII